MADNLRALDDWAGALMQRLSPAERRQLTREIGRELRRRTAQRIAAQQNPDGTPFAPRKPQLRQQAGRIKRRAKMFGKIKQARWLKVKSTADSIAIGYAGRIAEIARVHQYGLKDRPAPGVRDVRYARRELLGLSDADLELIRDLLLDQLAG